MSGHLYPSFATHFVISANAGIHLMRYILLFFLHLYQKTISPDHGWFSHGRTVPRCKFYPTCSTYAIQVLEKHGVIRGGWYAIKRVIRCHPWSAGGVDEV